MAYMSQDKKKQIATNLKQALRGSGLKYTLAVDHHAALVMNIWEGPVDFIGNYRETLRSKPYVVPPRILNEAPQQSMQVNEFHYQDQFTGKALDLLKTILPILNEGNWDKSDIQSDYFNIGWYVNVHVGRWNKPYRLTA